MDAQSLLVSNAMKLTNRPELIFDTGHRFRPIHDFGYVALDIIDLIAEDTGLYTCRAVNMLGADETNCSLKVTGKKSPILL